MIITQNTDSSFPLLTKPQEAAMLTAMAATTLCSYYNEWNPGFTVQMGVSTLCCVAIRILFGGVRA